MKTILIYLAFLLTVATLKGQDYFSIVKKNDDITYNYPKNSVLTLFDKEGNSKRIEEGDAIAVSGDYRLEIEVNWKEQPDVITSDGGLLEIFILDRYMEKDAGQGYNITETNFDHSKTRPKPVLERKDIKPSKKNVGQFNALFAFSNDMVFTYEDGKAQAYQNGELLEIDGKFIMTGTSETLKLSFDPKTGRMWYVFEKN